MQASLGSSKWGDAHLEEDPNPDLRALGFAVLVRDRPPETLSLSLVPASVPPLAGLGGVGAVTTLLDLGAAGAFEPGEGAQYRPMENRGLGGQLLLKLPKADGNGLYSVIQQVGEPVARLTDLILELDLRVCHDDGVAAALRSSSAKSTRLDKLVRDVTGRAGGFTDDRSLATRGRGRRLTLKYSIRSHRDRVLGAWKSAIAAGTLDPDVLRDHGVPTPEVVSELSFLDRDAPLDLLGSGSQFDLAFNLVDDDPLALAGRLTVTPAMLGLDNLDVSTRRRHSRDSAIRSCPCGSFEKRRHQSWREARWEDWRNGQP